MSVPLDTLLHVMATNEPLTVDIKPVLAVSHHFVELTRSLSEQLTGDPKKDFALNAMLDFLVKQHQVLLTHVCTFRVELKGDQS